MLTWNFVCEAIHRADFLIPIQIFIEFRYYLLEKEKSFDWIVEKGVYTSMQLAVFYEQGTVAPNAGELWRNIKNSYGFGTRIVLSSFVFRLDVGFSEEGSETTVFFGYPF